MFRMCLKISGQQNLSGFKCNTFKDLTKKCRIIGFCNNNLSRHVATQQKEENKFENIYYGPLTPQIRAVKMFSLGSSIFGLMAQPIIIKQANEIGSTGLLVALCGVVGFFTFVTPVLLHFITKKYVTTVDYDPETSTYRATTINFFMMKNVLEFKVEDVDVPDVPGMFTTLKAKGKPIFLEARHFKDPLHYAKMMGYDKPMDFQLGEIEEDAEDKKK